MSSQHQNPALFEDPQTLPRSIGNTRIRAISSRSILTPQHGRVSFVGQYDYTINPYQGCQGACDYCYAFSYTTDHSESLEWGRWVKVKQNAAHLLSKEAHLLDQARVYMATVTDCYQPVERLADVTGTILDVMAERTPLLVVQTRYPLVTRDIPRFQAIIDNGGKVQVNVTITTDHDDLRKILEPQCPSIPARMSALKEISEAGITGCATVTPMLPINSPHDFANRLLDTGIGKVIIQPFHRAQGNSKQFRRTTRPAATEWLEKQWGKNWREPYSKHYCRVLEALQDAFPNQVGEGQAGFAPPF